MGIDVSAIIVSFNTSKLLKACLESLLLDLKTADLCWEIMVVDNCSSDDSTAMVEGEFPQVRLIRNTTNRGFAAANNQALRLATGRHVLALNPDTEVVPGALRAMVDFLDSHPDVAIAGPRLLNPDRSPQEGSFRFPTLPMIFLDFFPLNPRLLGSGINGRYPAAHDGTVFPIDHPLGACFLISMNALSQVGSFDEGFFMYCEEVDLCLRLSRAGWKIFHVPGAAIIHHGGQSARQVAARMYVELYRSRYRLFAKHYSPAFAATARQVTRAGAVYATLKAFAALARGHLTTSQAQERVSAALQVFRM